MRMNEIVYPDAAPIEGYGPGFFRVGGQAHPAPVIVMPSGVRGWDGLDDAGGLVALQGGVDVILLGTGPEIAHPPAALRRALEQAGIGLEPMASPNAARTYNVLLAEGRRVAAALLPI